MGALLTPWAFRFVRKSYGQMQGCCKKNDPKIPPVFFLKPHFKKPNKTHQKNTYYLFFEKI